MHTLKYKMLVRTYFTVTWPVVEKSFDTAAARRHTQTLHNIVLVMVHNNKHFT